MCQPTYDRWSYTIMKNIRYLEKLSTNSTNNYFFEAGLHMVKKIYECGAIAVSGRSVKLGGITVTFSGTRVISARISVILGGQVLPLVEHVSKLVE